MPTSLRVLINQLARDQRQIKQYTSERTAIITIDQAKNIITTRSYILSIGIYTT